MPIPTPSKRPDPKGKRGLSPDEMAILGDNDGDESTEPAPGDKMPPDGAIPQPGPPGGPAGAPPPPPPGAPPMPVPDAAAPPAGGGSPQEQLVSLKADLTGLLAKFTALEASMGGQPPAKAAPPAPGGPGEDIPDDGDRYM
jgi:hypothetical protein